MTFEEANKLAGEYLTVNEDDNLSRFVKAFNAFNVGEGPIEDNICESCTHKHECSMPSYTNLGFHRCNFYEAMKAKMTFEEANRRYQKAVECHRGLNGAFGIHLSGINNNVCDNCIWRDECSVNSLAQTTFKNLKVQKVIDSCLFHNDSLTEDEDLFHRLNDAYKACTEMHDETHKEFNIVLEDLKTNSDGTGYVKDRICKECSNRDICNVHRNSNVFKVIVSCRHFDSSDDNITSEYPSGDLGL